MNTLLPLYLWNKLNSNQAMLLLRKAVEEQDAKSYIQAVNQLLPFAENDAVTDLIIKEYITRQIINDKNAFSDMVFDATEQRSIDEFAQADIHALWRVYFSFDWDSFATRLGVLPLNSYQHEPANWNRVAGFEESLRNMVQASNSGDFFAELKKHLAVFGSGELAEYTAYHWDKHQLSGVRSIGAEPMDNLIGVDYQKDILLQNTEDFLQGKPANHVLLCGSMGSGKSSLVKALLPYFNQQRLRLIEISACDSNELGHLFKEIDSKRSKYILFLDDLTMRPETPAYSALKVALDGQLSSENKNVLFYATSNRRNLVQDSRNDRLVGGGDLHAKDTLQEQYSLAERFGIKLYFPGYDQQEYLSIVQAYLAPYGVIMDDELRKQAAAWATSYHGRSGRAASNFAKSYCAKHELSR